LFLSNYIGKAHGSKILSVREMLEQQKIDPKLIDAIINKTGAEKLYKCDDNEDTLTLSIKAYDNLKEKVNPINFSNLIYVTENPKIQFPGNAFLFASNLKFNEDLNLIDINSGCSGFVDAIKIAKNLEGNTLIVCSETYSKNIKSFNRSTSPIFSDGAFVFLFNKKKISVHDTLSGFKQNSFNDLYSKHNENVYMHGSKVFSFTSSKVLPSLINFLEKHKQKNIKKIFLHQGSKVVCDFFLEKLANFKVDKPSNIKYRGNSVSSTIPILIIDDNYDFKSNEFFVICGFGVGLNFSIALIGVKDG